MYTIFKCLTTPRLHFGEFSRAGSLKVFKSDFRGGTLNLARKIKLGMLSCPMLHKYTQVYTFLLYRSPIPAHSGELYTSPAYCMLHKGNAKNISCFKTKFQQTQIYQILDFLVLSNTYGGVTLKGNLKPNTEQLIMV